METQTNTTRLPEALLMEILARLPMRSISRFKSVCKTWKTTLSSVYFRRRFLSLHQNSFSSWSLIRGDIMKKELMGSYRCETWNLRKSPASYIPWPCKFSRRNQTLDYSYSSNGLVVMEGFGSAFFVGNPLLQKWVKVPYPPYASHMFGLVTRVDVDGVVLSFKIVRSGAHSSTTCLHVHIYSSETGIWNSKRLHCPFHLAYSSPMSLNGSLYLLSRTMFDIPEPGVLIAHDFYSETDQCQVIPLPDHYNDNNQDIKRALTTSGGGFVMYIKILSQNADDILKVWRLNNDLDWQLLWEINLPFIRPDDMGYYAPMAMHPFDSDIVYIWSEQNHYLVSFNLRTQNHSILRDASKWYNGDHQDNCFMNRSVCHNYMDEIWGPKSIRGSGDAAVALFQFVLPQWMEYVPCPPQAEIINTTSLLSYIASMHKRKRGYKEHTVFFYG